MGQRSQIYIRYKDKNGVQLVARYFGWNFGVRMISRTRGIIEWLTDYLADDKDAIIHNLPKLERICDVNFDMKDVVISTDIKAEIVEQFFDEAQQDLKQYLFGQDNNDGQLLIDVDGVKVKYALIPYYTESDHVMGAREYLEWNDGKSWMEKLELGEKAYTMNNIQYISNHAKLMTAREVYDFINYDYDGAVFGYPF